MSPEMDLLSVPPRINVSSSRRKFTSVPKHHEGAPGDVTSSGRPLPGAVLLAMSALHATFHTRLGCCCPHSSDP